MEPFRTSQDDNGLHMLPKPGGSSRKGSVGVLSLAHLSGPLPILTLPLGREPCLDTQEFSVSFPSGIRRASSLTSSLALRLGPSLLTEKASGETVSDDGKGKGGGQGGDGDIEDSDMVRCPECALFIPRNQIVRHIRSTCRLVPCTLCKQLLLPAARELHIKQACSKRRQRCQRCGQAVIMSEFARHDLDGGCARRTVSCLACKELCFADELLNHKAQHSNEREVRCPSCGVSPPTREHMDHATLLDTNLKWRCPCGKGPLPLEERPKHLRKCDAFIGAWEASIEQVMARMPKIQVIRAIGKVMTSTRVKNPAIVLSALAESSGNISLATRKIAHGRHYYLDDLRLAVDIVNVRVFLEALQKPGKRRAGSLWREGM